MQPATYSLIIPSWYPTPGQPLTGIFIQKHVRLISSFIPCVVLYSAEGSGQPQKTQAGQTVEYTFYYKAHRSKLLTQLAQMQALWQGYKFIHRELGRPAVIHNHVVFPAGYFAWFLSVLQNIPLLITEHWSGYTDADGRYKGLSAIHHFTTHRAFARAKAVSVVSGFLKNAINEKGLTCATQPVLITSNVLNLPGDKYNPFNPATPKALFIGNLNDHEKNVSGLLEATKKVAEHFPGFTLTIIGGGNDRPAFEKRALDMGLLNTNVIFKGSVPNNELLQYYAAADFFVLNSNFETFNIAAAEALMNGLPVISTRCGGPEEFVNESNGMLTAVNNHKELAENMIRLIENYSSYNRQEIARQMEEAYSNTVVTEQFKKMYSYI